MNLGPRTAAILAAALLLFTPASARAQSQTSARPGDVLYRGTRVVTMDAKGTVVPRGGVLVRDGKIVSVLPASASVPAGVTVVDTGGAIYPGMIDLHDHTAYNFIPPEYAPPRDYGNRDQWPKGDLYERFVKGPKNLVEDPLFFALETEATKYAMLQKLAGGVTAVQGSPLDPGSTNLYVRNVEYRQPDMGLKDAIGENVIGISKYDKKDKIDGIREQWKKLDGIFIHLSEGKDEHARVEYDTLRKFDLVTDSLIGIHSTALGDAELADWAKRTTDGPKIVWSPASNLLLYGKTLDVLAALEHGATIALGTDWGLSGSKNLLGELKVAKAFAAQKLGGKLSDEDLVRMVTTNPARLLKWEAGSLEPGKVADLVVADDQGGDPYANLVDKTAERNVRLVVVGGEERFGDPQFFVGVKGVERIRGLEGRPKAAVVKREGVPKGDQSLADIVRILESALRADPEELAKVLNANPDHRAAVAEWLADFYRREGKKVPARLGDPKAKLTKAEVRDYIAGKYPSYRPLDGINTLFQEGDARFESMFRDNIHFKGPGAALDLTSVFAPYGATASATPADPVQQRLVDATRSIGLDLSGLAGTSPAAPADVVRAGAPSSTSGILGRLTDRAVDDDDAAEVR